MALYLWFLHRINIPQDNIIKTEDGCLLSVPLYFQIENTLFPYNSTFKIKVLLILDLGNIFREPCLGKVEISKELFDRAILLLVVYPKEILVYLQHDRCPRQFISALFTIHWEDQKPPKWHANGRRTNSMKLHPHNGTPYSYKREGQRWEGLLTLQREVPVEVTLTHPGWPPWTCWRRGCGLGAGLGSSRRS